MYKLDDGISRLGSNCLKWDLTEMAAGEKYLLPFWIADLDFPIMEEVSAAMRARLEHPVYGYEFVGDECKEAVCGWYNRRHGQSLSPRWLVPSAGVMAVIAQTLGALTKPGDEVLVFTPVYTPLSSIIEVAGRSRTEHPLIYDGSGYEICWQLLEEQLRGGVRAVLFCNPHNPIAKVWTREECRRLTALCEKYGVYLLSDEVHGDYAFFGNEYISMTSFENAYERLAIFTSPGKSFNLAGLGVSVSIVPGEGTRDMISGALKSVFLEGMNSMAIPAVTAAYSCGDVWMDEVRLYIERNILAAQSFLTIECPKVRPCRHEGTFLMWLDCRGLEKSGEEIQAGMAKHGILVDNGRRYGELGEGFLRFNVACPRSQLQRGLDAMAAYCNSLG